MLTCAWLWLYAGAFLMLMELLAPGFVIFFFGLSAATVGALRFVFGDAYGATAQLAAFSAFSVFYLVFLRRWLKRTFAGATETSGADFNNELVGRAGSVTESIAPPATGRVMVGDAEWNATADEVLEAGSRVKVVEQANLTLRVARFSAMLFLPLAAALSGCLSSAPKAPSYWLVEWERPSDQVAAAAPAASDIVRLSSLTVCAPYDGSRMAVLRSDGSVAFDAYNSFAAAPASLLKNAALDALSASGRFGRVLPSTSTVSTRDVLELSVTRFALDCRRTGSREASVSVTIVRLRDRAVVASSRAEATAPAADGNYTEAFSAAFSAAVTAAASKL